MDATLSIDERARALYEDPAGNTCVPSWDQLGEGTKSVWRGYVRSGHRRCHDQAPDMIEAPTPPALAGLGWANAFKGAA